MKIVSSNITIGNLNFDFFSQGWIKSSWKYLTDTAEIVLPKKIAVFQDGYKKTIQEVIKKGDAVTIQLGYGVGNLKTEFEGYVQSVSTGTPTVIKCEDEMWKLKQTSDISASWKSATLKDVVDKIAPGHKSEVLDMKLGAFRIDEVNAAQVLNGLKEYGLNPYFKNKVLHVGFRYPATNYSKVNYNFQENVPDKDNSLTYRAVDDIKLKVKATSILPTNEKIEIELGDSNGAIRTLHYYDLTKKELEAAAKRDMDKLRYNGLEGSFMAFAEPFIQHGDVAVLVDKQTTDHEGSFFVDSVVTKFSCSIGIKRIISLGKSAA